MPPAPQRQSGCAGVALDDLSDSGRQNPRTDGEQDTFSEDLMTDQCLSRTDRQLRRRLGQKMEVINRGSLETEKYD
jgi:hypothetical protein